MRGEVAVTFSSNRPERSAPGAVLFAGDRELVVVASRPHQGRVLRAASTASTTAPRPRRCWASSSPPRRSPTTCELDERELWVHEVVGAEVLDRAGAALGRVVAVEANPAHDLLVLDGGALVPMVFVVEQRDGVVVIDPPDGLFDL